MSDTPHDHYRYNERAEQALLDMVRGVLQEAAKDGLPSEHHFYITFLTHADGVQMTDTLRRQNPIEITIVLQNQFEELSVADDHFEVTLSFGGEPQRLHVPFAALTKFYDPSVAFGLMFDPDVPDIEPEDDDADAREEDGLGEETQAPLTGEVVSLDTFRDK